ncbi:hypothetical protein Vadar_000353 [Vaccinium darrowii]|uniref:Uncharacterized protein n=1 Tax=Vaccinium darrowii TaxID=229202 RepID=A0ACB7XW22_9ERIC|nr:hypothetical protein Vadar_000353 [Vaccinium darrowii]
MGSHYWKMKDADKVDPYQHPYRGISMDGWKWLIDNIFTDKDWTGHKAAGKQNRSFLPPGHTLGSKSLVAAMTISTKMVAIRDEARTLNMEVTGEYLSRTVLGERENYLRGFGVGPMPSSYTSISSSNSARQDQLQKMVDAQMESFRAEQGKEREEEKMKREADEQKRHEEREEEERRREEAARRQDENATRLQREIDVLKSLMMQQMKGQGNLRSG